MKKYETLILEEYMPGQYELLGKYMIVVTDLSTGKKTEFDYAKMEDLIKKYNEVGYFVSAETNHGLKIYMAKEI